MGKIKTLFTCLLACGLFSTATAAKDRGVPFVTAQGLARSSDETFTQELIEAFEKATKTKDISSIREVLRLEPVIKSWTLNISREQVRGVMHLRACTFAVDQLSKADRNWFGEQCEKAINQFPKGGNEWFVSMICFARTLSKSGNEPDFDFLPLIERRSVLTYSLSEDLERALNTFKEAFENAPHSTDRLMWAAAKDWYGMALQSDRSYRLLERIDLAISAHREALRIFTESDRSSEGAVAQRALGEALEKKHHLGQLTSIDEIIEHYKAALTKTTEVNDPYQWAVLHHKVGALLLEQSRFEEAAAVAEVANRGFSKIGSVVEIMVSDALVGSIALANRDWKSASARFDKGIEVYKTIYTRSWAHPNLIEALAKITDGSLFSGRAYAAAAEGDLWKAVNVYNSDLARHLRHVLNLESNNLDESLRLEARRLRALASTAISFDKEPGSEEREKAFKDKETHEDKLLTLVPASTATSEVNVSRSVLQTMMAPNSAIVVPIISAAGAQIIMITKTNGLISIRSLENRRLTLRLAQEWVREWANSYGQYQTIDIVFKELASLSPGSPEYVVKRREVNRLWLQWRNAIRTMASRLGDELTTLVVTELEEAGFATGGRLVFLVPGALTSLPLSAATDKASGRSLIDKFSVSFVPNLDALFVTDGVAKLSSKPSLFAIANPTEDLPFARIEGELVSAHFSNDSRKMLDNTPSPLGIMIQMMDSKQQTYWHFATHGAFFPEATERSGLYLARQDELNGGQGVMLSFRSLRNSMGGEASKQRLVVLSACETGRLGSTLRDREFTGIPGVFIEKGTAGVIATLWRVDDRATSFLMAKFYDLHIGEGEAPIEALRHAQLWLREATDKELTSYVTELKASGKIETEVAETLTASLRGGGPRSDRLALGWEAMQNLVEKGAEKLRNGFRYGDNRKPFGDPYYWAAFYYTGS